MAADLIVQVAVEGTQAISQAKQVGDALTQMGAAGTQAVQKIAAEVPKMSQPMKEATVAAAQAKSMFGELQAAAAKPVACGGAAGVLPLLQSLEKARVFYEQLNQRAQETASLGGKQAASFTEAANAAKGMTDALASTRAMVSEMVAEGARMGDVYVAVKEQITMLEPPLKAVSTEARQAFQVIETGLEKTIASTAQYQKVNQTVADGFTKEIAAAQKAAIEKERSRQKEAAAAEAARQKEIDAAEKAAAREAAAAEKAAQAEIRATQQAESAHTSSWGRRAMTTERGVHDILQVVGLSSGAAGSVGRLVRGVDDLAIGFAQGGVGMVAFAGSMAAFSAAMAAISAPLAALKEGMKSAGEEEKLGIGIKDVVGSSKEAQAQMEQLKDFVTGPLGAAFQLKDVAEGVRQLELLSNTTKVTNSDLRMLGAAAEANNQSFTHVAVQYGKVVDAINLGRPVRAQLLMQMQQEGLISESAVAKIENLVKAHADTKTILDTLRSSMNENLATAENLGNSYDNMVARLKQVFDIKIAEPFGHALTEALKTPIADLTQLFLSHDKEIQQMADTLEVKVLAAYYAIRDQGIIKTTEDGFQTAMNYVRDTIFPAFGDWLKKWWKDQWDEFGHDVDAIGQKLSDLRAKYTPMIPGAVPGPIAQPSAQQAQQLRTTGVTSGAGAVDVQATKDLDQQIKDAAGVTQQQTQAAKDQAAAAQKQTDAANKDAQSTIQNTTATQAAKVSLDALKTAIDRMASAIPSMYGGAAYAGPMGGPMQITHFGYPGDPNSDPLTRAGKAAFGKLAETGAALSPDLEAMFKAGGGHAMQQFVATLADGTKIMAFFNDRTSQALRGRVDLFDPRNIYGNLSGARVTSITPLPGYGPVGGPGVVSPDIYQQRSAQSKYDEEARRTLQLQRAQEERDQPKKPGGTAQVDQTAKKAKGEWDDLKVAVDKVSEAERHATAEVKLYDTEQKAGMISATQAQQLKIAAYEKEKQELQALLPILEQQKQKAIAANDKTKVQEVTDKLIDLHTKLDQITVDEDKIKDKSPWDAFLTGVRQAVDASGSLSKQMTDLGKSATDQFASGFASAFTSITDGSKTAKQAFLDFAKSFLDQIEQMLIKMLIMQLLSKTLGTAFGGGTTALGSLPATVGSSFGMQHGGLVYGPRGTDMVPVRLTAGEYVFQKSAVDRLGANFLHNLNLSAARGSFGHGFAAGGLVSPSGSAANIPPSMNPAGGMGGNVNVSTTVNVGGPQSMPGQQGTGGGGMTKEQITQFHQAINTAIKAEIAVQKRPGGLLNKHTV